MKSQTLWSAGIIVSILLFFVGGMAYETTNSYSIGWWTADGGGGGSSAGNYSLSGTIGQADAVAMAGGNYHLEGGFWGGGSSNQYIYPL
jgi:uncharacterized membrane protein